MQSNITVDKDDRNMLPCTVNSREPIGTLSKFQSELIYEKMLKGFGTRTKKTEPQNVCFDIDNCPKIPRKQCQKFLIMSTSELIQFSGTFVVRKISYSHYVHLKTFFAPKH